eukprot:3432237-Prymnesium_polylepis.1
MVVQQPSHGGSDCTAPGGVPGGPEVRYATGLCWAKIFNLNTPPPAICSCAHTLPLSPRRCMIVHVCRCSIEAFTEVSTVSVGCELHITSAHIARRDRHGLQDDGHVVPPLCE